MPRSVLLPARLQHLSGSVTYDLTFTPSSGSHWPEEISRMGVNSIWKIIATRGWGQVFLSSINSCTRFCLHVLRSSLTLLLTFHSTWGRVKTNIPSCDCPDQTTEVSASPQSVSHKLASRYLQAAAQTGSDIWGEILAMWYLDVQHQKCYVCSLLTRTDGF